MRRSGVRSSSTPPNSIMRGLLFALVLAANSAWGQTFPAKPVTLIVPFPPGGSTDTAARIIGERMRIPLGQSMIIENVGCPPPPTAPPPLPPPPPPPHPTSLAPRHT